MDVPGVDRVEPHPRHGVAEDDGLQGDRGPDAREVDVPFEVARAVWALKSQSPGWRVPSETGVSRGCAPTTKVRRGHVNWLPAAGSASTPPMGVHDVDPESRSARDCPGQVS